MTLFLVLLLAGTTAGNATPKATPATHNFGAQTATHNFTGKSAGDAPLSPLGFDAPDPCDADFCKPLLEVIGKRGDGFAAIRGHEHEGGDAEYREWDARASVASTRCTVIKLNEHKPYWNCDLSEGESIDGPRATFEKVRDELRAILPDSFEQKAAAGSTTALDVLGMKTEGEQFLNWTGPDYRVTLDLTTDKMLVDMAGDDDDDAASPQSSPEKPKWSAVLSVEPKE